jgi:hypothetical protein
VTAVLARRGRARERAQEPASPGVTEPVRVRVKAACRVRPQAAQVRPARAVRVRVPVARVPAVVPVPVARVPAVRVPTR